MLTDISEALMRLCREQPQESPAQVILQCCCCGMPPSSMDPNVTLRSAGPTVRAGYSRSFSLKGGDASSGHSCRTESRDDFCPSWLVAFTAPFN